MTRANLSQLRVVSIAVVLVVVSQFTMWEFTTRHADEQSRKICGVLEVFEPRPADPPPSNARSRLVVERITKAYRDLGCRS